MFIKADGQKVWLQSDRRLPYLAIDGFIDSPDDVEMIRDRLKQHYNCIPSIAAGGAFIVDQLERGDLLFCINTTKECAFLFLAEWRGINGASPIDYLHQRLSSAMSDFQARSEYSVELRSLRCECAMMMN